MEVRLCKCSDDHFNQHARFCCRSSGDKAATVGWRNCRDLIGRLERQDAYSACKDDHKRGS